MSVPKLLQTSPLVGSRRRICLRYSTAAGKESLARSMQDMAIIAGTEFALKVRARSYDEVAPSSSPMISDRLPADALASCVKRVRCATYHTQLEPYALILGQQVLRSSLVRRRRHGNMAIGLWWSRIQMVRVHRRAGRRLASHDELSGAGARLVLTLEIMRLVAPL